MLKQFSSYLSLTCVYEKGMAVYQEHDRCDRIGVVLEGKLAMVHYTFEGEERVLAQLQSGDMFGDFLINSSRPFFPGHLIAKTRSKIAYIHKHELHLLIKQNDAFRDYYLSQLSEKALQFNLHNKILLQASLRDKIVMWLSYQPVHQNKVKLQSKQLLANQLNVTRPSLSRELANMKRDGWIDYDRHFIYLKQTKSSFQLLDQMI